MSRHSKWNSIKHRKGIADAKRGKIFTKHAKLIAIAARSGGAALRLAIDNAKADNMPSVNIDRAVKKGTGEDKEAAAMIESTYEGYGPGGVALFIETISDNKNRTVANLRGIFTEHGGSLGESGCVAWMFEKKGEIIAKIGGKNPDEAELAAIDAGADDLERNDEMLSVYTQPSSLTTVADMLKKSGFEIQSQKITFVPKDIIKIEDQETAQRIIALIDTLNDDDDVTNVASNFDLA